MKKAQNKTIAEHIFKINEENEPVYWFDEIKNLHCIPEYAKKDVVKHVMKMERKKELIGKILNSVDNPYDNGKEEQAYWTIRNCKELSDIAVRTESVETMEIAISLVKRYIHCASGYNLIDKKDLSELFYI